MVKARLGNELMSGALPRWNGRRRYRSYFPMSPTLVGLGIAVLAPFVAFAARLSPKPVISGPGISAAVGDRLSRPFVSTKKDRLGVGPSISRAIIEGHGGDIWVVPNVDGGAVFKFTPPSLRRGEVAHAR